MNLVVPQRATSSRSFVLLAPQGFSSHGRFQNVVQDSATFKRLQSSMQRLRGRVYLEDGAISRSELSSDGRHMLPSDDHSWHLLTVDADHNVIGCTRYLRHDRDFSYDSLRVRDAAIAHSREWGARFRSMVEHEIRVAREAGMAYVEVGGWALDKAARCTTDCVRGVLATFAWSRVLGGALGICTATVRHSSAMILRKLGGREFECNGEALPSYYDERYGCEMHLLRFDSRLPNPRYEDSIRSLEQQLRAIPVVSAEGPIWKTFARSLYPLGEAVMVHSEAIAGAV